ncbi:MAG: antitoxin [Sciscionella sp.]
MSFLDQARDQAKDVATKLTSKAGEVASEVTKKARPLAEKAGQVAAKGVDAAANSVNKMTGGKYEGQIKGVNEIVGDVLGRNGKGGSSAGTGRS